MIAGEDKNQPPVKSLPKEIMKEARIQLQATDRNGRMLDTGFVQREPTKSRSRCWRIDWQNFDPR